MTTQTQTTQQDRKRHPDRHTYPDKDAHIRVSHILHHKRQQMLCQILNTTQHQLTGSSLQRFLLLHINNNHNNKAQNGFGRSHIWDMLIPVSNVESCSRQVAAVNAKLCHTLNWKLETVLLKSKCMEQSAKQCPRNCQHLRASTSRPKTPVPGFLQLNNWHLRPKHVSTLLDALVVNPTTFRRSTNRHFAIIILVTYFDGQSWEQP